MTVTPLFTKNANRAPTAVDSSVETLREMIQFLRGHFNTMTFRSPMERDFFTSNLTQRQAGHTIAKMYGNMDARGESTSYARMLYAVHLSMLRILNVERWMGSYRRAERNKGFAAQQELVNHSFFIEDADRMLSLAADNPDCADQSREILESSQNLLLLACALQRRALIKRFHAAPSPSETGQKIVSLFPNQPG